MEWICLFVLKLRANTLDVLSKPLNVSKYLCSSGGCKHFNVLLLKILTLGVRFKESVSTIRCWREVVHSK